MKRKYQNLKLIIPFKANDLFSISKYQKRSLNINTNSFFNTQYQQFNSNTKNFKLSLKETKVFNNRTNYNIAKNTTQQLIQVPYPSFPNKKPIPILYKNSIKLVKCQKIQKENFIFNNYNNNNILKNRENQKFFNTFSELKVNPETHLSKKSKTQYKGGNNFINLNISPIRKETNVKHNYKLKNSENKEKLKKELKKRLNINNFDNILNKIIRLIEIKDEHNNGIKYIEVTNLLLDEINNLIENEKRKQRKNIKRKIFRTISTSISNKYFKEIKTKLDLDSNVKMEFGRKKIKLKTFRQRLKKFYKKFGFEPILVNKEKDEENNDYENNLKRKIKSNKYPNNNIKNIQKRKNIKKNFELDADFESYNLYNLMMEKRGGHRKNVNFDSNFYHKYNDNNNIYNNKYANNTFYNSELNYNHISGNNNNFLNQSSRPGKNNRADKSTQFNVVNILNDLTSKIENKEESKKIEIAKKKNEEKEEKEDQKNKKSKDNSINNVKRESKIQNNIDIKECEKYIKNKKLINLIKQFSEFENIDEENNDEKDEENPDNNSSGNNSSIDENELNNNSSIDENESNTLDDNTNSIQEDSAENKDIKHRKTKRKKRNAITSIIRKIDFGIEIIKNICEEVNLNEKGKEDLNIIFNDINKISLKKKLTKDEIKIQKKVLKAINDFIRKYLTDIPKINKIKARSRNSFGKYFKNNLNFKLEKILYITSENNSQTPSESTPRKKKKKNKKRPKNIEKKKLNFDNSYFFKAPQKKQIPLKDISLPKKEESFDNKNKQNNYSDNFPKISISIQKKGNQPYMGRRNAIFKIGKKREGLLRILPSSEIKLKEEEKIDEKEILLDRKLKAFFEEIKILKKIDSNNNSDQLNSLIDKEIEKIDYVKDKVTEGRKYNFYEGLKSKTDKINKDKNKKFFDNKRFLFFQSPVIFNMHKDKM